MSEVRAPTPAVEAAIRRYHEFDLIRNCAGCDAKWPCDTAVALTALDAARAALRTIRDQYGQVCERYATCDHAACRSSSSAWVTADKALRAGAAVAADGAGGEEVIGADGG